MNKKIATCLAASMVLSFGSTAFAAQTASDETGEIEALKARLTKLEGKESRLEKKADAAKAQKEEEFQFSGDYRFRYLDKHEGDTATSHRWRLAMDKKISDNIAFNARFFVMDNAEFGNTVAKTYDSTKDTNRADMKLSNASVTMKNVLGNPNDELTVGRFGQGFLSTGYWASEGSFGGLDGAKFSTTIDKGEVTAGFGNWGGAVKSSSSIKLEEMYYMSASYPIAKETTLYGMYLKETEGSTNPADFDVRGIGFKTKLTKDFRLYGDYTKNIAKSDGEGMYVSLRYKQAKDNVPKSYEIRADYRNVQVNNTYTPLISAANIDLAELKGFAISGHYVFAKNARVELYQQIGTKYANNGTGYKKGDDAPEYTRLQLVYKM